jgi:hypothetical protein
VCTPNKLENSLDGFNAMDAITNPLDPLANVRKKYNTPAADAPIARGTNDGQTYRGAEAAPAMGARRRNNSAMGGGSLLTGPSGIDTAATGKTSLLGG